MVLGSDSKVEVVGVAQAVRKMTRENPRVDVKMHFKGARKGRDCKGFAPKTGVADGRRKAWTDRSKIGVWNTTVVTKLS